MFGFSIFMNEPLTEEKKAYIKQMADSGFQGIFTSMHIPEDDPTAYKKRLMALGECAKNHQLDLMVDISGDALSRAGFSFEDLKPLKQIGVTGLRMDYHISNQQIADWSHQIKISLNASTITAQDVQELEEAKADFTQLEAWHNYYPRPETGLDYQWYAKKNRWLKEQGFTIQGFVPGDKDLRGPVYQGLPTLEKHRNIHPLAAAIELAACQTDLVYIGDGGLSEEVREQFLIYQQEQSILLHIDVIDHEFCEYVLGNHTNRQDDARDVLRSADARFRKIPYIPVRDTNERKKGSVTLDNEKYCRYMGEIQITKRDLPADEKVNRVARVIKEELPLLEQIHAGVNFKLIKKEKKAN
ncbi:MAG TPA: DUF871 domain-containing protein [Enterococcus sp.]|nr:DUF871 domain-containing protein [Enterococcus sp.]